MASPDLVVELLPAVLCDPVVTQPVELRECRHQRGHERVRAAAVDVARNVLPGARTLGREGERLVVRREGIGTRLRPAGVALLQELQQPHLAVVQRLGHVVLVHVVERLVSDVRRNVGRRHDAPASRAVAVATLSECQYLLPRRAASTHSSQGGYA